jgi:peptidoglycan/xylan/chitin deacetylase (PgdA/CDA1 family)
LMGRHGSNWRNRSMLGILVLLAFPGALATRRPATAPGAVDGLEAPDFSRGNTAARQLALTFDADDQSEPRLQLLDILEQRRVRTTFFLTGRFIEAFPDIVRRIVRDGHEVGNHSYDHPELTMPGSNGQQATRPTVTKAMFQEQLRLTERVFTATTGARMVPLWRAPGGEHNEQIRGWAAELGYVHVGWTQDSETGESLDSLDWVAEQRSGRFFTPAQIRTRLLNFGDTRTIGANGGIALFHLGSLRTPDAAVDQELGAIIDGFRDRGYELVRVSELYPAALSTGLTVEATEDVATRKGGAR